MAEGRRMHVKSHRQIFRLFLLQNLEHDIQEAIYRIGMEPLGIAQIRHTIERSVQYAVPVNQNHFFYSYKYHRCHNQNDCQDRYGFKII